MLRPTLLAATAVLAVACHGNDPAKGGAGSASSATQTTPSVAPANPVQAVEVAQVKPADIKPDTRGAAAPTPPPPPGGHDFTPEARALLAVGACADLPPPSGFDPKLLASHCDVIKEAQTGYLAQWVRP